MEVRPNARERFSDENRVAGGSWGKTQMPLEQVDFGLC